METQDKEYFKPNIFLWVLIPISLNKRIGLLNLHNYGALIG